MPRYTFFLGQHPSICAGELWQALRRQEPSIRIYAADSRQLTLDTAGSLPDDFIDRLGGTDRIAIVLAEYSDLPTPAEAMAALGQLPAKWKVGISTAGLQLNSKAWLHEMKKLCATRGSRLKFVLPTRGTERLNAAQIIFNELHKSPNAELTFIKTRDKYILTRTIQIQNIINYEIRDTQRPARDRKVGMLPPKLAQIMINLADNLIGPNNNKVVLDPFCGMGTILQESWLMGYQSYGTDISGQMITNTRKNLDWLAGHFGVDAGKRPLLSQHDVTRPFPEDWSATIDIVATEVDLGAPLLAPLPRPRLNVRFAETASLLKKMFINLRPVLKTKAHVLAAFPAIRTTADEAGSFTPLPKSIIDELASYGYRMKHLIPGELALHFPATERGTLMYARPKAYVARELTLWEKV